MIKQDEKTSVYKIICDEYECGASQTYDANDNWWVFIRRAQKDGWHSKKEEGCEWYHKCPKCAKKKER